mmetsp:Transcript_23709/g.52315  ORF Transcript_23709/g.52315 Transcript_23709/m.52315 type:complete len:708 (-) Transcript_23709:43-2166(-)
MKGQGTARTKCQASRPVVAKVAFLVACCWRLNGLSCCFTALSLRNLPQAVRLRRLEGSRARPVRLAVPLEFDEKVVGIDLGTTTSVVATVEAGLPEVIPNAEGSRGTPSIVAFTNNNEILVGEAAKRQAALNPTSTFHSVKRFIGRKLSEVSDNAALVPYTVSEADGRLMLTTADGHLHPEEVSAHVLKKLRDDAAEFLEASVEKAVITVPAYFNDAQRQATKDAGRIAGLEVLRISNEPTMAAFAYGLERRNRATLLVLDLGGGTFDVSLMDTGDGVCEVLATGGDTRLGGDDFDLRILSWLADTFESETGIDLRTDPQALQRISEAAEKAKIELSSVREATISVPFIATNEDGPLHLERALTTEKFMELCGDLIERCREPIFQALQDARIRMKEVTEVILVGGSSRIPAFQEFVHAVTGGKPVNSAVNPEEVVAVGAALQAAMICGEVHDIMLIDVTPLTLGCESLGGIMTPVIERNTAIPRKKSRIFTTSEDGQDEIEVNVYQGERPMAADNKLLGSFRLTGIPPAPAGVAKIEVTFEIDREGILTVSAKDWATRQRQVITIDDASTLQEWEVERLRLEATKNEYEDARQVEQAQVLQDAKYLVQHTEENLADLGPKVPEDARYDILPRVAALQVMLEQDDVDFAALQAMVKSLQYKMMLVGQRVYGKQTAPDGMPGPARPRPAGGAAGGGFVAEPVGQEQTAQ